MERKQGKIQKTIENRIRHSTLITVICDVVLIAVLVACLLTYISRNNVSTYNQNIKNITNITTAKSELMLAALESSSDEVKSVFRYCNGKSVTQIMDYLSLISDSSTEYQLLRFDDELSTDAYHVYSGYSTHMSENAYTAIEYARTDLTASLDNAFSRDDGEVCYSQSFTNKTDALRYFAAFCGMSVTQNGKTERYYLVKPLEESRVLAQLQSFSQYEELSTAICYADGKYMACDSAFRANNIYDYLYKYNGLSIDERNALRESVQSDSDGVGFHVYKDFKNRQCVFAYAACSAQVNWYIIVSVPMSEFVSEKLLSFFPLMIIAFLAVLLIFNIWRLLYIVKQLRLSVERERIANTSKSSFLSRMSHEIRTPLNAVIGYNTIAKGELSGEKTIEERNQAQMRVMDCLIKSDTASKHLLTIINDVLDMSAIESGKMSISCERFDFKGLINSLTTVFYTQASRKGVDLEVVFDTLIEEWLVGDQLRTNQILTNLLSNAIKFTPEGGTVKLTIQQRELVDDTAHIHFDISDTGIGMAPEYLERIWSPFEQADASISRRFGGTGLGLSITKSIVDLMGGTITVESTPGQGTTFGVDLAFKSTYMQPDTNPYDFSGVNTLVVDDDKSTCNYIRLLFNRCGAKCSCVTSGADAVSAVAAAIDKKEPYTVCMVDLRMPEMDGTETISRIRELTGDTPPIIVLTAYDFTEIDAKPGRSSADRFISKPLFQSSIFDLLADIGGTGVADSSDEEREDSFYGVRVLLAEDNTMNMEIAQQLLEVAGFIVDSAWNGKEAVEKFEASEKGTYAAILMDIQMPYMDGHEATRTIRSGNHPEAKTIPIIAMTADAFAENVAQALAAGMNDHIAKPIDVAVLFSTLKKHIASE